MFKRLLFLTLVPLLLLKFSSLSYAQPGKKNSQLVQFSGIVVDKDSLQKIPFAAILVKRSSGGTIADNSGYFSFIATPGDTVLFSAIGFKTNYYVLPDTLSTDRYSWVHLMSRDTTSLKPFVFYSWPSKEAFRAAFLKLDIADNDLDRARRNMALAARKARFSDARSPGGNYLQTVQQENDKLYWAGQLPPNNLLNPIAWAKFIQAWKDGSLNIQ
jgi:CarboxypepD_reg-like domain